MRRAEICRVPTIGNKYDQSTQNMNLSTVPTEELVRLARENLEANLEPADIFGELGRRYSYSAAPKEDREIILEFDRTFVIPRFGRTKLPPKIIHLPGTQPPTIPDYYKAKAQTKEVIDTTAIPKKERLKRRSRGPDFFVSYNGKDIQTARYLRQWLEDSGYSTFMQEPDFPPTSHIIEKMEEGMNASRLLAVVSDNYLHSDYCRAEFGAALMRDPLNKNARIVIARISRCEVPALWAPISRIDLTSAGAHIRDVFLNGISKLPKAGKRPRAKSSATPSTGPQPFISAPAAVSAQATGPGSVAAGRDFHFHYQGKPPRGQPKAPPDVIDESQAAKLKQLFDEVVELDSASPDGEGLNNGELIRKWWGALGKVVPGSGYRNYSQSKFKRAMNWLRQHRARLASGAAAEEPAMASGVMIRAIHTYITRNHLDKISCYNQWSARLGISPAFASTKNLSYEDLKRVYGAMRRDSRGR